MKHKLTTLLLLLIGAAAASAEKPPEFLGNWIINHPLTEELAVEYKGASGLPGSVGKPTLSVGGIPLPLPGGARARPMSKDGTRDPDVLHCNEMTIDLAGKEVVLNYHMVGTERLRAGKYKGRNNKWSRKRLQQTYRTTERKVKKTLELRNDGRLLVTVVLNPHGDRKRTYKRVFDRKPA